MSELLLTIGAVVLWAGVFVLLALLASAVCGRRALTARGVLLAYPAFYALQIVLMKALDLAGALRPGPVRAAYLLLACGLAAALAVVRRTVGQARHGPGLQRATVVSGRIALACGGIAVLALAGAAMLGPQDIWDTQTYHLPMVATYYQQGSLAPWPTQCPRQVVRPNGAELQMLTLALLSASDAPVELANVLALAVGLAAAFEIAREALRQRRLAHLSALLVLTAPQVLLGAGSADNDVVFTAAVLCGVYWAARSARRSPKRGTGAAAMAGLSVGLACATKVLGAHVAVAAGLALAALWAARRVRLRTLVVFAAVGGAAVLLFVGHLYWRNIAATGLPFGLTPSEQASIVRHGVSTPAAVARFYFYELCFKRLVAPLMAHDWSHFGYLFPPVFLGGVASAVHVLLTGRLRRRAALASLAIFAPVLFLLVACRRPAPWDQRFMTWMVPCFGILAVRWFAGVRREGHLAAVSLVAGLALAALFNVFGPYPLGRSFWKSGYHLLRHGQLPVLLDVRPADSQLEGYAVLDERARPGDAVLYVGGGNTWMYPCWGRAFARRVDGVGGEEDMRERARSGAYRFIVVEGAADKALRRAAMEEAQGGGYEQIAGGKIRTILERPPPQPL